MKILGSLNNNTNFTGVIPVKVYVDGMQTYNEKNVKAATRQLISTLVGPLRDNVQNKLIAAKLAQKDPDYSLERALSGYKQAEKWKKFTPSDFFRLIFDHSRNPYLVTGSHAEELARIGKDVGHERHVAKLRNEEKTFDLHVAKKNYERCIKNCLNNLKLRVTELFDPTTKKKAGAPVELCIHMESNKKYGKSTFKMKLTDISFDKIEKY